MANDETKSVTTSHEEEQMIIEKHEQFGWSLHSSQEVLSQAAHSTDMGYYVKHTTTTTNYVKLIFKRDRDFPNAKEIRPLEDEYWENFAMRYTVPKFMPGKIITGFAVIYIIAGIVIFCSENNVPGLIFSFAIGLLPAIIRYFAYYKPKANRAAKAYDRCCDISEKIDEINHKASESLESN